MSRIAYVNGRYLSLSAARLGVEDRALQFSDGVYEVMVALNRRLLDEERHLDRLERSLSALRMATPVARSALRQIVRQVIARNHLADALIYVQVSRGEAPRDHAFPTDMVAPSLIVTMRRFNTAALIRQQSQGVAVITVPDQRWARRDIKSVSLLPNVLAKQAAREAGAFESWMVDEDGVTEGSSTTAWIIAGGRLITRNPGHHILPGVTRAVVGDMGGCDVEERPFTVAEAHSADEAFITSATSFITPVVRLNGQQIGTAKPGPVTQALIARHWNHVRDETGRQ